VSDSAFATFISFAPFVSFSFPAEIDWDGAGWLKGNAGQAGFYRVNYEQQQWDELTNQLDADHKVEFSNTIVLNFYQWGV